MGKWTNVLKENYEYFSNYLDLPNISGIYCIENIETGMLYIGQSVTIKDRIKNHMYSKDDLYIHRAIRKYGRSVFNFYILERIEDKEKLSEREVYYIDKFDSFCNGYNLTKGGEGGQFGTHMSEKNKKLMSKIQSKITWAYNFETEEYITAESRLKLSIKLKKLGFEISDQNIYDALDGNSYSKCFTFGNSKDEAYNTYLNVKDKIDKGSLSIFLYDYVNEEYSPKFTNLPDAENYIRSKGCDLISGHLSTALKNNNTYIKNFLFAQSEEELKTKVNNFSKYLYFYHIPTGTLYRFTGTMVSVQQKLLELGFKTNLANLSSTKRGEQKQHKGFIIGRTIKEVIVRALNYSINLLDSLYKLTEEYDYVNEDEIINAMDALNEISVRG